MPVGKPFRVKSDGSEETLSKPSWSRIHQSALLATILGIASTLLTFFAYRAEECRDVVSGGLISCAGLVLNRGLPLGWVTTIELA